MARVAATGRVRRATILAAAVLAAACGAPADGDRGGSAARDAQPAPAVVAGPAPAESPGGAVPAPREALAPGVSPLAGLVRPAGSTDQLPRPAGAVPTSLRYAAVEVEDAPVVPVGAEPDGAMEIPGADEVGWYRFGPVPGGAGSAVLASHVAFDGRDGVFRRLARAEPGDAVEVGYDDGTARRFEVVAVDRVAKVELPAGELFRRDGPAQLVLITCGGEFDPGRRSYQDNVVVHAVPAHATAP